MEKEQLLQSFQEKISKFNIPTELSLLGMLTNERLLNKLQISCDDYSENFILSYDKNSEFLGNDEGKYVCKFNDNSFEIKHVFTMQEGLRNEVSYNGIILNNGNLSVDSDRIFKNLPNDVAKREQFNYVFSNNCKKIEHISRKKSIYYSGSTIPANLESYSSINFISTGAVVYDHLKKFEGVFVSDNYNNSNVSSLTESYDQMFDTISSMSIPIEYKAGQIDDIRTEEQFADFMVNAMANNQIDVNGSIVNQNNEFNNNSRSMGFTGIQLVGLISFISTIIIAMISILFLIFIK